MPLLSRTALAAALASLAVAAPAQAQVDYDPLVAVCNQATPTSLGGNLIALDGDPLPPARYADEELYVKPGKGLGLQRAASRSHALQICAAAPVVDTGTDPRDGEDDGSSDGGGLNT